MTRKFLIAGNWKMNKTAPEAVDLINEINTSVGDQTGVQVCVCPPFTSLSKASELVEQSEVLLGAQNMNASQSGAYTGEISAEMLRDLYVSFVILGHSERREYYGETNETVNKKILSAIGNNLKPIYCIGETLEQREAGQTLEVVRSQVREGLENFPTNSIENLVLAYEPVWAIGTGNTASLDQISEIHTYIRSVLVQRLGEKGNEIPILYGGSCNSSNTKSILTQNNVDGSLVGGASLDIMHFQKMINMLDV